MIYGSVCSGIEAATVAWHPLGWRPAFFAEIEAFPSAVIKHHYPDVSNVGDFTRLIDAAAPVPAIDVLVGGTPCQSFSVAGLRRGLADARGGLTLEFVRLAQRLRPRWIVWENVPGVLSQDGGRAFGAFLGALVELGYGWAYRVLDAQYFGVAQRRRRVFVVGHSGGDFARAASVLLEPEGVRRDPPTRRAAREGAAAAPVTGAQGGSRGLGAGLDGGRGRVAYGFQPRISRNGRGDMGDLVNALNAQSGETGKGDAAPCVAHIVAPPLTASNDPSRSPQSSEVTAQVEAVLRAQYPEVLSVCGTISDGAHNGGGLNGQDAYTGRVLPVAFTGDGVTADPISAHEGSTYTHEGSTFRLHNCVQQTMAVRRLTPVECERLQGFPDEYTRIQWKRKPASECPDGPRYKALGNSMAVPVMRWIGERIAKVEAV